MLQSERKYPIDYKMLVRQHLVHLKGLQYSTGLFAASNKSVKTGYDKSWLRDNFYECMAFEAVGDWNTVEKAYAAILKVFLKHEKKIDRAITKKPRHKHDYLHARYHPETFDEYWEDWGNKQNDSIGAILFGIGRFERHSRKSLLEEADNLRIVSKLVKYLASVEYWHDKDSGMWEEDEEVHASSLGACIAGLRAVNDLKGVEVPSHLIEKGEKALNLLLPRESKKKFVDLALLSLIWPYNVANEQRTNEILRNVEYHLVRKRGVIRYKNDKYHNKNLDGVSEEAEWTFGLSWLSIIYSKLKNKSKAKHYLNKAIGAITPQGIPELYYSNTDKHNENNPLGWSESLFIIALQNYVRKHKK